MIEKFGSFYVGGRKISLSGHPIKETYRNEEFPALKIDQNGDYIIEQAYVQYFRPKNAREIPIILIHGGGLTGSMWETTPDGRNGWIHYFLERRFTVYVIDNVERGRAGWCALPGIWKEEPEMRSAQRTWDVFRIGKPEDFYTKKPYLNSQFPVKFFDELMKGNVPRWSCNTESSLIALNGLVSKIGDCIIVSHSQSSNISIRCAETKNQHIKNIVLLEPASFPMNVCFDNLKEIKFLFIYGDNIEKNENWKKMFFNGVGFAKKLLDYNNKTIEWLYLPKNGIIGNTHQLMMDKNNKIIFDIVIKSILKEKPCQNFIDVVKNEFTDMEKSQPYNFPKPTKPKL